MWDCRISGIRDERRRVAASTGGGRQRVRVTWTTWLWENRTVPKKPKKPKERETIEFTSPLARAAAPPPGPETPQSKIPPGARVRSTRRSRRRPGRGPGLSAKCGNTASCRAPRQKFEYGPPLRPQGRKCHNQKYTRGDACALRAGSGGAPGGGLAFLQSAVTPFRGRNVENLRLQLKNALDSFQLKVIGSE